MEEGIVIKDGWVYLNKIGKKFKLLIDEPNDKNVFVRDGFCFFSKESAKSAVKKLGLNLFDLKMHDEVLNCFGDDNDIAGNVSKFINALGMPRDVGIFFKGDDGERTHNTLKFLSIFNKDGSVHSIGDSATIIYNQEDESLHPYIARENIK